MNGIHQLRIVDERLATSGQPTEGQLAEVAASGYQTVVNLALHDDPRYSLPDEAGTVRSLGMRYVHIPVAFNAPTRADLDAFFAAMDAHAGERVLLHCAANYRVSAFLGLYRAMRLGQPRDEAFALQRSMWTLDATWQRFVDEQLLADYYARRAAYYERVYFKPERQADLRAMEAWIGGAVFKGRRVLEIACGTGWWTPHGGRAAQHWLATDLNPETMAVARAKPMPASVEFRAVDAFTLAELRPVERFDAAFAGCWWSHLPLSKLPGWLALLHARLEPGARVVMLDNSFTQTGSTPIARHDDEGNGYQIRTLDDGSTHEVLKNFPSREQAVAAIGPAVRDVEWHPYEHYWLLSYTLA